MATGLLIRTLSQRFLIADLKGLVKVNKALLEGETQQEEDYYYKPYGSRHILVTGLNRGSTLTKGI